jgi:multiple sugar transport system permease protein
MYMGYATLGMASPIYVFNIPSEFTVIKRLMIMDSVGIMLNATMVDIMIAFPRKLSIPSVAYPMYMYLYYNHFKGMPKELQEAAIIDGASYWKIFTKIMMPLSKPIITTVAIMAFIRSWSDLLWPTLVTRDGTYRTLPLALKSLFSDTYTDWGQVFAFSTLMVIPTMILFLVFQKQFVASVTSSGIKG